MSAPGTPTCNQRQPLYHRHGASTPARETRRIRESRRAGQKLIPGHAKGVTNLGIYDPRAIIGSCAGERGTVRRNVWCPTPGSGMRWKHSRGHKTPAVANKQDKSKTTMKSRCDKEQSSGNGNRPVNGISFCCNGASRGPVDGPWVKRGRSNQSRDGVRSDAEVEFTCDSRSRRKSSDYINLAGA